MHGRIAHAYYKYGRFCSSHPVFTILVSIFTIIFLSFPLSRLQFSGNSANDVIVNNSVHVPEELSALKYGRTFAYIQQFIVQSSVDSFESEPRMNSAIVRTSLKPAFDLQEILLSFRSSQGSMKKLGDVCFRVGEVAIDYFPKFSCLILSPALLWHNKRAAILEDRKTFDTITGGVCSSDLCYNWMAYGVPPKCSGILSPLTARRRRTVQFAVTVFFDEYDECFLTELKKHVQKTFDMGEQHQAIANVPAIIVFFTPPKRWIEYVPLVFSYFILLIYVYYSVSSGFQFQFVKSKWGLAFCCVFTVASSLVMAAGICIRFDLSPVTWGSELFPYLAMVVGLENTLCITRSVVSTPVHLDVRSRIAHGLSREGFSITRNFLTELLVLAIGFFTFLPEVQEFCTFACIGLVVDFYMQLFFYAPCLTFDLLRIDSAYKEELSAMQEGQSVVLVAYPEVNCPFAFFWPMSSPSSRSGPDEKPHVFQEDFTTPHHHDLNEGPDNEAAIARDRLSMERGQLRQRRFPLTAVEDHPAAATAVTLDPIPIRTPVAPSSNSPQSRLAQFCTGKRLVQRFLMLLTLLWIVWLAVTVHELKVLRASEEEGLSSPPDASDTYRTTANVSTTETLSSLSASQSEGFGSTAQQPQHWISENAPPLLIGCQNYAWQKQTLAWWPALFSLYNLSIYGRHINVLPPLLLRTYVKLDADDVSLSSEESDAAGSSAFSGSSGFFAAPDVSLRISWLELQMTIVLVLSCGIFVVVAVFIVYVMFAGGSSFADTTTSADAAAVKSGSLDAATAYAINTRVHRRIGSKTIVETVPITFSGHQFDVDYIAYDSMFHRIVSVAADGTVYVWDARTGEKLYKLSSRKSSPVSTVDSGAAAPTGDSNATSATLSSNMLQGLSDKAWSVALQNGLAVLGFASGRLEFWDVSGAGSLKGFHPGPVVDPSGIIHMVLRNNWLVCSRANGFVEVYELQLIRLRDSSKLLCNLQRSAFAHQRMVNALQVVGSRFFITASDDHTVKVFELCSAALRHTLIAHNAPVLAIAVDEALLTAYSSCSQGLICVWDLCNGLLLQTVSDTAAVNASCCCVAVALNSQLLIAQRADGNLWLWKKLTSELVTRINQHLPNKSYCGLYDPVITTLNETTVCCATDDGVQFWDVKHKLLLRDITFDSCAEHVQCIIRLDETSVACACGTNIYRLNFPLIRSISDS